jgi:hypothetical protein
MLRLSTYSLFLVLLIGGLSSCSQKDNGISVSPTYGKWALGAQEYNARSALRVSDWGGKSIKASAENAANTIVFGFKEFPTASGQYEVVEPSSVTAGSKQLSVSIYTQEDGTQNYYVSTSNGSYADVVVNNNKVSISIPLFVTEKNTDSTNIITATVTNIQEQ